MVGEGDERGNVETHQLLLSNLTTDCGCVKIGDMCVRGTGG